MLTTEDTEGTERATPETDAAERMAFAQEYMVPTDFARKLERERDEAAEDATNYYARLGEAEKERDEARRVLRKFLKEVLQLIDSQDWKSFMESRETARRLLEGWE